MMVHPPMGPMKEKLIPAGKLQITWSSKCEWLHPKNNLIGRDREQQGRVPVAKFRRRKEAREEGRSYESGGKEVKNLPQYGQRGGKSLEGKRLRKRKTLPNQLST